MKVTLDNVGIVNHCEVEFVPGVNLVIGNSGSGKSTLIRSIYNIAANEFADSDISFGKNTMTIKVEHNSNIIEYSRSIKAKGERCYYTVNNEQYVKLGRQPLQAVKNILKIGDVNVNGEDVNFNFNLQFSSPFLILGSQSTLYNVLTYRSNFDISSINDFYTADIKNNAYEVASNTKLKETLTSNLESLKKQADALSSIENIYSDYIEYKHQSEKLEDITSLFESMKNLKSLDSKLDEYSNVINDVSHSLNNISTIIDLSNYSNKRAELCVNDKSIMQIKSVIDSIDFSINKITILNDIKKCEELINKHRSVNSKCTTINNCLSIAYKYSDDIINGIVKCYKLNKEMHKCDSSIEILNKIDSNIISLFCELLAVDSNLRTLDTIDNMLVGIKNKSDAVIIKMKEFNVCPLCGNSLESCDNCL